jgi:hypothetical protein
MRAIRGARLPVCGVVALVLLPAYASASTYDACSSKSSQAASDVSPPTAGFASDQWLASSEPTPWSEEHKRRQHQLDSYFCDDDPGRAAKYGFRQLPDARQDPSQNQPQNPRLAWTYFTRYPIGYGGVPYVLLQTLLSLDPATEQDPELLKLARIWRQPSRVPGEQGYTLDHLGIGPDPADYDDGIARAPGLRGLPNGLVYDPEVSPKEVGLFARLLRLAWPDWRRVAADAGNAERPVAAGMARLVARLERAEVAARLKVINWLNKRKIGETSLALVGGGLHKAVHESVNQPKYDRDLAEFQKPPGVDAVFFSCTACHQGRVIVDGAMDASGRIVRPGRVQFLPGMPNTEIEAQYYSELLMKTGFALLEKGFSVDSVGLPASQKELQPDKKAIEALLGRMLERALDEATAKTIYGESAIDRAKLQTYWVARDFPTHVGALIGTAIKTQYVYVQIAGRHAYAADGTAKPDLFGGRVGQMDAFGLASGLVAIHSNRQENSYLRFLCRDKDNWAKPVVMNPLFQQVGVAPGPDCDPEQLEAAGQRIRDTIAEWAPPVPAPVDIPSLSWSGNRALANWDGNQGASARTLASGTSATGDPMKVNVRIHEPLNPLINNMPPPPYPFAIDREKARRGMQLYREQKCGECHVPKTEEIISLSHLEDANKRSVDANRARVTSYEIGRYGMAGLVMEACRIFVENTGNDWCLPRDAQGKVERDWTRSNDDYFKDTPGRVKQNTQGYKADMQYGIWARAPYLHNGSVPTLGALLCPQARPAKFLRGVLFYDEKLVGFEWHVRPQDRYSPFEIQSVIEYDTTVSGRSNGGHSGPDFGSNLCPDLAGLDPVQDREKISDLIANSDAGALIEYMKTF